MDEQSPDLQDATRSIKEQAAKQKIELNLVNLKVAGYWYAGDTCCV